MSRCIDYSQIDSKPFTYTMSLIDGKWKMHILFWLWKMDILRYGELKKALEGITHKMLSTQLKELEKEQLIVRHEYPQVPPKVEYRLSERGQSLMPVLHAICKWGGEHEGDLVGCEGARREMAGTSQPSL